MFRARYRVRNAVGWSAYSPVTLTRAARRPAAPILPPVFTAATSTTMSVALTFSEDNGGAPITRHELWIDDGALGIFQPVNSYGGASRGFTIEQSSEAFLVTGLIYRVKSLAVNEVGPSDFSAATSIALADLPSQANAPAKIVALSTQTKFVLTWAPAASTDSPGGGVTGYRLEMDDGLGGDFEIIYNGFNAPSLTSYIVGGSAGSHSVVEGRAYRFRLAARAFNGLGATSPVSVLYACTLPQSQPAPRLFSVAPESMVVEWGPPLHNGACPLTGFALYADDGASGVLTAVPGMATDVPTTRQASLVLTASDLGKTFTVQVVVSNREGTTSSPRASFLFAVEPSQPASGPQILTTSSTQINVRFD